MGSSRRDQLVDAAVRLFNRDGFHATGIDAILAEAGVAKMTLYHHFRSKDELILAALRRRDEEFRNWFMKAVEARAEDPADRLLAVFDVLGEWFRSPDFHGCLFVNAAGEFDEQSEPVMRLCAEHKRLLREYVAGLARDAGATDPGAVADQIELLMEGAVNVAHVHGRADAAATARAAAAWLITSA